MAGCDEGLDDRPIEAMWVLAPVDGVQVNGTVRVGVVEFTDATVGQEILRRFSPPLDPVFSEPLADVDAFARVAVVASVPYDAEQEGLALIDTATAWLTTRLRYSWSHAPDGRLEHYERAPTRVTVERRDLAFSPFTDSGGGGGREPQRAVARDRSPSRPAPDGRRRRCRPKWLRATGRRCSPYRGPRR